MGVRKIPFIGVRHVVFAAGIACIASLCPSTAAQAAPAVRAVNAPHEIVQWHRGIATEEVRRAKIVRVPHGFRRDDLAGMRDDQILETPSGTRMTVSRLRAIQKIVAEVRARPRAAEAFHILPRPTKPCTQPKPGETFSEILARPDTDVVCMGSHNTAVSVAQLRLMKPYIERTRGLDVSLAIVGRAALSGPAIPITDNRQLATLLRTRLKDAPDSTVLVNPKGQRITLGAVRAALKIKPELLVRPIPSNDRRR